MRTSYAISTWVLTLAAMVSTASAQGRGGRPPQMETLSGEVTVKGVRPGWLQVTTQDGGEWWVSIPTRLDDVVFRAPATPQFLQPGMAVRFHTTFKKTDKRRKEYQATLPISALEIITVLPNSQPNLYPDDAGDQRDKVSDNGEDEEKPAKKEKEETPSASDDISCLVIGVLKEYKNNKIKVSAGPFPVSAELPETAEVSVDVRHCLWVRPGDKVELTARYVPALRARGLAEGQQMTITSAQPLTLDEKASKGRRRAGRERKQEDVRKDVDEKREREKDKDKGKDKEKK
jgi:hypothetical protein